MNTSNYPHKRKVIRYSETVLKRVIENNVGKKHNMKKQVLKHMFIVLEPPRENHKAQNDKC